MNETDQASPLCRRCAAALGADDNYCRRCGMPTPRAAQLGLSNGTSQSAAWESPWVILPLLFFVLGPLALPFLWRSRRFTPLWKWTLTIVVTSLTVLLVWTMWIELEHTLAPLQKALDLRG